MLYRVEGREVGGNEGPEVRARLGVCALLGWERWRRCQGGWRDTIPCGAFAVEVAAWLGLGLVLILARYYGERSALVDHKAIQFDLALFRA